MEGPPMERRRLLTVVAPRWAALVLGAGLLATGCVSGPGGTGAPDASSGGSPIAARPWMAEALGSSMIRSSGLRISAMAIITRCFMPPESWWG